MWFDAKGNRLGEHLTKPGEKFVAEEKSLIIERESQRVMNELAQVNTAVVPGREAFVEQLSVKSPGMSRRMHQVAGMPKHADPAKYEQTANSALANELQQIFEKLRQEYQSYAQSKGEAKKEDILCEFADKLFDAETQLSIDKAERQMEECRRTITSSEAVKQELEAERPKVTAELNLGTNELPKQRKALADLQKERGKKGLNNDRQAELDREISAARERIKVQDEGIKKLTLQIKALGDQIKARDGEIRQATRTGKSLKQAIEPLKATRDRFRADLAFVLDPKKSGTAGALAGASAPRLCFVISYFLYGQAIGVIPEDRKFADYFLDEFKKGAIAKQGAGIYYGMGGGEWQRNFGMCLYARKTDEAGNNLALGHPSRRAELKEFLSGSANLAITHQDFDHTPPVIPGHFLLIVNDANKTWRNMDHTNTSYRNRGGETDWSRVFYIGSDASAAAEAKDMLKKLEEKESVESVGLAPT